MATSKAIAKTPSPGKVNVARAMPSPDLDVMRVRVLGAEVGARRVAASKKAVEIEFEPGRRLSRKARSALAHAFGDRLAFAWRDRPTATLAIEPDAPEAPTTTTERFLAALADL